MSKRKSTVLDGVEDREEIVFSSGCNLLDLVVGGGVRYGYPCGKIINIVGDKSSGKSFLCCEIIAAAYYSYGSRLQFTYDDAESGFTFDTKKLYNISMMDVNKVKSRTVEEFYCNYREFLENLKTNEIGIYVLDSLDGLSSQESQERGNERFNAFKKGKTFDKGSYQMSAAKFLSQEFFKNLTDLTDKKNCLLIVVSQTRDKIDSLFKEQTRSGGKALDFYAHTVLWLSTISKIVRKDRDVGVIVKAKTKKSKTPRPFRGCVFTLLFDYGVDNIGSNLDFLFDLRGDSGKLLTSSNNILWSPTGENISSVKSLVEFITENGKLEEFKRDKILKDLFEKESIIDWISKNQDLKSIFQDRFGFSMKRDDLIKWIEDNSMESELVNRVINKWESLEDEIKTVRKSRYSL